MPQPKKSLRDDGLNVLRGVCMGCADVVPGVSGGTVALILGIYERLVTAISHVDGSLVGHLRKGNWRQIAEHLDVRFLVTLGSGILSGIIAMSLVINELLTYDTTRAMTLAAFFGMILASAIIVARLIRPATRTQTLSCWSLGGGGAVFAYWVSTLNNSETTNPSYGYIFVCGCVAICAMILPGISGAMILLVLGIYLHLTDIPHHLLAGEEIPKSLLTVAVFGAGCLISLIVFSKFLRWLLSRYHAPTMALLCGFMFGALRKLWPFQIDTTPEIEKVKEKVFVAYLPSSIDGEVVLVCGVAIAATLFVFLADRLARGTIQK